MKKTSQEKRAIRHKRMRKRVHGTQERPRLCVYRSLKHIYVQLIDDMSGTTVAAASTREKELRDRLKASGNKQAAAEVGKLIAERALKNEISQVVFDRGGFLYHGRVAALADAAREAGLKF